MKKLDGSQHEKRHQRQKPGRGRNGQRLPPPLNHEQVKDEVDEILLERQHVAVGRSGPKALRPAGTQPQEQRERAGDERFRPPLLNDEEAARVEQEEEDGQHRHAAPGSRDSVQGEGDNGFGGDARVAKIPRKRVRKRLQVQVCWQVRVAEEPVAVVLRPAVHV